MGLSHILDDESFTLNMQEKAKAAKLTNLTWDRFDEVREKI